MLSYMSEARRPGRWRTGQQSRQRIIDAARDRFMRDGYERATVRAIAADAGVDVAMVYYFFDNKEGLFSASALTGPEHPLHQLAALLDEGPDDVGPRLVRGFSSTGTTAALSNPSWRCGVRRLFSRRPDRCYMMPLPVGLAKRVAAEFGVTDAELRVELVASHLAGLAFARYQLKLEPIASTAIEDMVAWMGPTLQRYLTGD